MDLLILGILGFVSGIFSGLIGVGGGLLIIPALLFIYPLLTGHPSIGIKLATGLSAVQSLIGSLSSAYIHHRNQQAHLKVILLLGVATMIGAFFGGWATKYVSELAISWVYIIVLGLMICLSIYKRYGKKSVESEDPFEEIPGKKLAFVLGIGIGALSGLMGIGGAILLIPLMTSHMKMPTRLAIGSSSGIIFITSIGTTIGKALGHLILPAEAAVIAIGALFGGYIGANLSKRSPESLLFWLLMAITLITVARMIVELIRLY